jgi:polygalacturonase
VNLDGVMVTDDAGYKYSVAHADIKVGPGPVNLKLEGEDTTVTGSAGTGSLESCAQKLVPFPR